MYSSCLAEVFISVAKREEREEQPSNTSAPHLSTMNISSAIQLRTIDVGDEAVWYNRDEVRNLHLYVFIHFLRRVTVPGPKNILWGPLTWDYYRRTFNVGLL